MTAGAMLPNDRPRSGDDVATGDSGPLVPITFYKLDNIPFRVAKENDPTPGMNRSLTQCNGRGLKSDSRNSKKWDWRRVWRLLRFFPIQYIGLSPVALR